MAAPKGNLDIDVVPEEEPAALPVAVADALPLIPGASWTITEAFGVLRRALELHYQDDDLGAYLHLQELAIIVANSGGSHTHPNSVMAWRQIIPLLEQVLGAPLRVS